MNSGSVDRWVADELARLRQDLSRDINSVGKSVERLAEWKEQQDRATNENQQAIRAISDRLMTLEVAASKSWMNFLSMLIAAMIAMTPVAVAAWKMLRVVAERAAGQ